ncbi:MAG: Lacal_2735 family protein [Planctomycetaceae bacterium]|nr:Lacal_2735 family protein [Planctomycetaceae bacterium]MDG1807319.1 Lacal_2735 family protein [Pirellulaceae bacterium]MDG2104639.1 Lacal_2735 family protein [Pirellulaceae bacterium]
MFGRKTEKQKLTAKYEKLLKEAFQLSSSNRQLSDEKTAEAERVREQLDKLVD